MTRKRRSSDWVLLVFCSGLFALCFVLLGGISDGFEAASVARRALAGALVGLIAAPEFEPQIFRYPAVWQMAFSCLGCVVLAFDQQSGPEGYVLAIVGGAALGWLAPVWIKHI